MKFLKLIIMTWALGLGGLSHGVLIGHWKFDEVGGTILSDSSTGAHPGTLSGNAFIVSGGISGNAVQFDSAGNGIARMGNFFRFVSGSFTISAWIKTTSSAYSVVAGKHDAGHLNGYFLGTGAGSGYGAPNKAHFYQSNQAGGEPISATPINTGNWIHLAGVYRAGISSQIYVNGVLEATKPPRPIGNNERDFCVGGLYLFSGYAGYFTGLVDDVQVYDSALTSNQVGFLHEHPGWTIVNPHAYTITEGSEFTGGLSTFSMSDDARFAVFNDENTLTASAEVIGLAASSAVTSYSLNVETSVGRPGLAQQLLVYNYSTQSFQSVDGVVAPIVDSVRTITMTSSVASYVSGNREVKAKLIWNPINDEDPAQDGWLHSIDELSWELF